MEIGDEGHRFLSALMAKAFDGHNHDDVNSGTPTSPIAEKHWVRERWPLLVATAMLITGLVLEFGFDRELSGAVIDTKHRSRLFLLTTAFSPVLPRAYSTRHILSCGVLTLELAGLGIANPYPT